MLYSHALGKDHPQTKEAFERADVPQKDAAMGRMSISYAADAEDKSSVCVC